jgi:hypothetical protein
MDAEPRPIWNSPVAATLVGALLGTFGTITTFRVTQADVNGQNTARIEALQGQVADMKQDIREIRDSLRADRTRP